jgi:ectoine hydroxylase-related dioxygenase (phytanoyl-CoA dioxygenase family)
MHDLDQNGFVLIPAVIAKPQIASMIDNLTALESHRAIREKSGATYAVRRLCELSPAVRQLSTSAAIRALIEPILGPAARVVRGLLFDKTAAANWKVPWHQDLTIAVKERRDAPGFGPWSIKADITHVQPPLDVLEQMLTIRLHLDDCGPDNGPLRVLPGSHKRGVINASTIAQLRQQTAETLCTLPAGGALVMRPLLLHASAPATSPGHRRVIHLEFAANDLPDGLQWHES